MQDPNIVSRAELTALIGAKSPSYINELEKTGRAIRAPDGKNWLKAESLSAYRAARDPSRQGVADHWARQREANAQQQNQPSATDQTTDATPDTSNGPQTRAPAPARPASANNTEQIGSNYQQARAVKEKFFALEAKRAYEVAIGQLRSATEVEALAATSMTELRIRLENLAYTVAPSLAAETDEHKIRAQLQDNIASALESASHHFARLAQTHAAPQ